ncbi:hypothetical protein TKK_0018657 [Trichogramma kaykai]
MGDFNARNVCWNCECTDDNGRYLQQAYKTHGLVLHNFDTITYASLPRNYGSNIDLVFSTPDIDQLINTEVCEDSWGLDHYPLITTVSVGKHKHLRRRHRINSTRTEWDKIDELREASYTDFFSETFVSLNPAAKFKFFYDLTTEAISTRTPHKKI